MSAAGAREKIDFGTITVNDGVNGFDAEYEFRTNGSLALQRMERRSEARQIAFQPVEERVQVRAAAKKRRINAPNLILLSLLIFSFAMGYLFMQTKIQQNNIEIAALQKKLTALQKEGEELEMAIVMGEDLDAIRTTAKKKFGMVSPGEGQIIIISPGENSLSQTAMRY